MFFFFFYRIQVEAQAWIAPECDLESEAALEGMLDGSRGVLVATMSRSTSAA